MPADLPIHRISTAGVFVTGTDTGVGKTVIAAAIAATLHRAGRRVAVLKPVATGCVKTREGFVSEDAELLAAASETDQPLDLICPNRYLEPLAPSVAARRSGVPLEYSAIARSIALAGERDAWVVEGAGGVLTPLGERHLMVDLIAALGLPTVLVATAKLGTINHTLLSLEVLSRAGITIAGVVLNGYPAGTASVAEETAAEEIERLSGAPVLAIVPQEPFVPPWLPPGVLSAVGRVDWLGALRRQR